MAILQTLTQIENLDVNQGLRRSWMRDVFTSEPGKNPTLAHALQNGALIHDELKPLEEWAKTHLGHHKVSESPKVPGDIVRLLGPISRDPKAPDTLRYRPVGWLESLLDGVPWAAILLFCVTWVTGVTTVLLSAVNFDLTMSYETYVFLGTWKFWLPVGAVMYACGLTCGRWRSRSTQQQTIRCALHSYMRCARTLDRYIALVRDGERDDE